MQEILNVHQLSRAIDQIFSMYDTNKNGLLEDKEIRNYLVEAIHVNKRLTKRDVNNFIMGFDQNGDGKISKTQFMRFLKTFL